MKLSTLGSRWIQRHSKGCLWTHSLGKRHRAAQVSGQCFTSASTPDFKPATKGHWVTNQSCLLPLCKARTTGPEIRRSRLSHHSKNKWWKPESYALWEDSAPNTVLERGLL
jgi:hypothetical protein